MNKIKVNFKSIYFNCKKYKKFKFYNYRILVENKKK